MNVDKPPNDKATSPLENLVDRLHSDEFFRLFPTDLRTRLFAKAVHKHYSSGLVEAGEVFGETALLDGLPRTTDAGAKAETSLMILRRYDFMPALKSSPDAILDVIKMLCHRLRIYLDTIDLIALQNLPRRFARHLMRLAADYGVEENGVLVIRAGLNQASIGQQLATSRARINKQLRHFASEGLIKLNGNEIALLDSKARQEIA